MDRRVHLDQPLGRAEYDPGLLVDDRGHVIVVLPGGERFDLTLLIQAGDLNVPEATASDPDSISLPLPPTAADTEQTFLVGAIPYNVAVTGIAYIPSADILFPARVGDNVNSRGWIVKRQRPSEAYDLAVRAAIVDALDPLSDPAPATADGVTLSPGELVLVVNNSGLHGTPLTQRNGVFRFDGAGLPLVRFGGAWSDYTSDGLTVYVNSGATLGGQYFLATVIKDPQSPNLFPLPGWQFDAAGPAAYSSAIVGTALYDGEESGPLEGEDDDYSIGIGTAVTHGGKMAAGVPYAFDLNQDVALSMRAGDIVSVTVAEMVDQVRIAPPGSDITFDSPADPGGLLVFEYLVVQEQNLTARPFGFADRAPQIEDETAAAADDPASEYLNATRADLDLIGRDPVRDAMDPGGGGGPPRWYCFEWFENGQGGKKRWGLDYPGWIDFANELRARGQSEANWACAHKELAQCIGARVIHWRPPYGEYDETTLSDIGYQCIQEGSAFLSVALSVAAPIALRLGPTPAGIAVGAGALLLAAAFEPGTPRPIVDRVEIRQEILHGFAPVTKKLTIIENPPVSHISNPQPISIPGLDTRHGIAGDLSGSEYGPTTWVDAPPYTAVGTLVKARVYSAGEVFEKIGVISRTVDVAWEEPATAGECRVQPMLPVTETELNGTGWPQIKRPAVLASITAGAPRGGGLILNANIYAELFNAEGKMVFAGTAEWDLLRAGLEPSGLVVFGFGKERNFRRLPGIRKLGWFYTWAVVLVYESATGPRPCHKVGTTWNPLLYDVSSDHGINFGVFTTVFPPGGVVTEGIR